MCTLVVAHSRMAHDLETTPANQEDVPKEAEEQAADLTPKSGSERRGNP